ncbi:hypothetical protein [Roseomonas gilardii]|uniref:hypothetical protein n=1 Tax=Roseomonas gilardii TaxID=257708 RepID=UPI00119FBB7B|nr:hypothetical protein [Roseomonas gilardii]
MSESTVLPFFRLVAAGHRPNNRLHLVLVITPAKSSQPGSFELREWPSRMLKAVKKGVTVRIKSAPAIGPIADVTTWDRLDGKLAGQALTKDELDDVDKAWQAALFLDAGSWADLAADIDNSLRARKREAYPPPKAASHSDRPGAKLGCEGELLVPPPRPGDVHAVEGVVPLAQTALATEAETVRAARILTIMEKGRVEGASPPPSQSGPFADEKQEADARKAAFHDAYKATQPARNRSRIHFDAVKSALDGTTQRYMPPAATALVPQPDLVCNGRTDCPNEASHAYGTTLQRTDADPGATGSDAPISQFTMAVRARFYALGGDSILSRLFGLCVDLTIDASKVPPGYVHLAAELPDFPTVAGLPLVVTAARRDGDHFWPCSMFDPDAKVARNNALVATGGKLPVTQAKGVWCMAGGTSQSNRFELASLDVRSATERARARTAQGSKGDRGEQHRTAGFVLLDRQRADEAARDLAIGATQAASVDGGKVVVLHAEELTVGRRVDAAAVIPGALLGDATAIKWRTLMGRMVHLSFPAHHGAESALRKLLPSGKGGLRYQDGSFQTGARLLPKPDQMRRGNAVPVEAVVEEAIFTWDGTPAGALTDPGAPKSADAAKLEPAQPPPVPWHRTQRPPLLQDGTDLRPAPLRYGAPYVFGLTSIFLGGIGPSVEEASLERRTALTAMLPNATKVDGKMRARPRRFLRHEGIGAPTLLFPRNVALRQNGKAGLLGFEPLDSAIVRTVRLPADPPLRQPSPEPPAADRDGPHETTRVFLPPELVLDAVARHGMLDVADPSKIVRGGLQHVTFRPRRPGLAAGKRVAQGFPTVETFTRPGLGGEQATLRREVTLDVSTETGLPLFEPGPNTIGQREPGFLPDPAAEFYCLRARIPGTACYLDGAILVPVYQLGHAYPDALPLVVQLGKHLEIRKRPATSVNELKSGQPHRRRMLPGGAIAPAGTPNGAPIWFLVLALCPDEEFDLEVTCLPSDDTLACWFAPVETMAAQLRLAEDPSEARRRLQGLAGSLPPLPEKSGPVYTALCNQPVDTDAISAVARALGRTLRERRPIEEIAAVGKLRILHAVNRPEAEPGLRNLSTRRPSAPTKDWQIADVPGSTTMLLDGLLVLDLEQVSAVELVATTISTATNIDDPTRSRSRSMRRSGRWPRTVDANGKPELQEVRSVLGFDVDRDGKVTLLPERVQLLGIDNLPTRAPVPVKPPFVMQQDRQTVLDLGELHKWAIAGPPAGQPDNDVADDTRVRSVQHRALASRRARLLHLQLVLVGRHVEAFETAPRFLPNATPLYRRRMSLPAHEQTQTWPRPGDASPGAWPVWVKATERPPPPDPLRPELSFHWERKESSIRDDTGKEKGYRYELKRSARVRLWFRRGWFASGEGERLGIVLWPPNHAAIPANKDENLVHFHDRDISVATLDDADLGPGGVFVSRWGGDPIRGEASPQVGVLIPPTAFAVDPGMDLKLPHDPQWVHMASMPRAAIDDRNPADPPGNQGKPQAPPDPDAGSSPMMGVTLLTFEPYFDLDREHWFVDVPLLPTRAVEPFVRFGLVRYQEQAINDSLRVSRPVMVMSSLLPERAAWADVWTVDQAIQFDVTVQGGGSTDAALPDWHAAVPLVDKDPEAWSAQAAATAAAAARPVMRLTLIHERDVAPGQVHRLRVRPDAITLACDPTNALLKWTSGTLSVTAEERRRLKAGRYVAIVEEVDLRMQANYAVEPVAIPDMFKPEAYVDSGPRFIARIVLIEDEAPLDASPKQGVP